MRGEVAAGGWTWLAALALAATACAAVPPPALDPWGPACRARQAELQALAQAPGARACREDSDCRVLSGRGLPGCCWLATSAATASSPALGALAEAANRACPRVDRRCPPACTKLRCVEGTCRTPPHCDADPACY